MATDPWPIDNAASAPSYSAAELRLVTTTPFLAGAAVSLGARSGVRASGSGTDLLVQAQASPNMTVKVNTGCFLAQGAISATQGVYTWALDTVTNVTISAAHATLSRTDLIAVRIRDANVDTSGQRDGNVIVVTGTAGGGVPSLPSDASYFTIAQIAVAAAVTTITSGNITDKRQFTAALGGVIPCTSATEPAATAVAPGQPAFRTDLGANGVMRYSNGTFWVPMPMTGFSSAAVINVLNSTTFVNATGIAFPVDANAKYIADFLLLYAAGTVGDMKIGLTVPASATAVWGALSLTAAATTDVGGPISLHGDNATNPALTFGGTGSAAPWYTAWVRAYIKTAGTSGTAQLQFAQNTADNASNTSLFEGSSVVAYRVA